jgi:DHA1 family bicyclomycin/chloramphenicol resistance-like MFS transporter
MSSSAVLPVKVPPIGVLILAASSANLGLAILSPVITILRDDFSASADRAQLVLSAFMLSVAISQLISGSLSDRFGRKKVLLGGSVIFIIGGIGALLSTTIDMLIGFRILQGAGAAACMTMGRVIVNDVYQGSEAARKLSIVSSAQAIVPALGFAFGGVIAEFIGWRGSIGIMVMGALLIAVMSYLFIDESRRGDPVLFRPAPLINAYLALLKTSGVMFHGLTSGLAVGMFFAMGGAMPYAFYRMGIGPLEYGLFFALTSIGYILGNFINRLLVGQVGVARMAYLGSLLTALVPMLMLAGDLTGLLTPLLLSFLCFSFGVCNGLVVANAMICSMRAAGRNSGAGTGLLGAMQMLFGGVAGSAIIALGGADYFSVTATGLLIMTLCAVLSSFLAPNSR